MSFWVSELEWHHNVFFQLFGEMIVGESQRKTYSETMKREREGIESITLHIKVTILKLFVLIRVGET